MILFSVNKFAKYILNRVEGGGWTNRESHAAIYILIAVQQLRGNQALPFLSETDLENIHASGNNVRRAHNAQTYVNISAIFL